MKEMKFAGRIEALDDGAVRDILALTASREVISFAGGNPPADAFPVREIAGITAEALENCPAQVLQYGETAGYAPLLDTLRGRLEARLGAAVMAENAVFTTTGSQQTASLLAHVLLDEGDVAVVEEPSFVGYLNSFRAFGARLAGVPMQPDGMDVDALAATLRAEPRAKLLYMISNFQNPTGFTTSAEKRAAIYRLAQAHDLIILEDDAYGELRFSGAPVPPVKQLDTDGRVVYTASFSKVFAPAFRLGYALAPRRLAQRMLAVKQCADVHTATLFQYIAHRFMTGYDFAGHLARLRALYGSKCALMLDRMERSFHPSVRFNRPEGGMFVMAFLPEGMDAKPFVQQAVRAGVACVPGMAFSTDQSRPSNGFRMNYSMPSDADIVRGVDILGRLTHRLPA